MLSLMGEGIEQFWLVVMRMQAAKATHIAYRTNVNQSIWQPGTLTMVAWVC